VAIFLLRMFNPRKQDFIKVHGKALVYQIYFIVDFIRCRKFNLKILMFGEAICKIRQKISTFPLNSSTKEVKIKKIIKKRFS
jgi:hypothetical protein